MLAEFFSAIVAGGGVNIDRGKVWKFGMPLNRPEHLAVRDDLVNRVDDLVRTVRNIPKKLMSGDLDGKRGPFRL